MAEAAGPEQSNDFTSDQREKLVLFGEVTGHARNAVSGTALLASVGWDVERAVLLHLSPDPSTALPEQPDLMGAVVRPIANQALMGVRPSPANLRPAFGLPRFMVRSLQNLSAFVVNLIGSFVARGSGSNQAISDASPSGPAFASKLSRLYGPQLVLPCFFEGSFVEAVSTAHRGHKLVAIYLHDLSAPQAKDFCAGVLGDGGVRAQLNEHFVVWAGDARLPEPQRVGRRLKARRHPYLGILLPLGSGQVRLLGAVHGDAGPENAAALLTSSLAQLEQQRALQAAQRAQQVEDRQLREAQDREFEEALAEDRLREEQRASERRAAEEAEAAFELQRALELQAAERREARRRGAAAALSLAPELPLGNAARIALRLPGGQRLERRFPKRATLAEVYAWAECAAYLPENAGRNVEVPDSFELRTTFPARKLTEMSSTVEDLGLSGTNIMLAEIEAIDACS